MSNEGDNPRRNAPCFYKWCPRFDEIFRHQAQKREFRNYLGELLGESEPNHLSPMVAHAVRVTYHKLHHFLSAAPWSFSEMNQRHLKVMNQCHQTTISQGFYLILDDSLHRYKWQLYCQSGRAIEPRNREKREGSSKSY
ncbi:transposase [Microcoleus sp. MON1_C5]|uniref:transposase n=1 Tax=Microcoleus sp. MON1_C5 TaxID=2818828 RepID=UPI00403F6021